MLGIWDQTIGSCWGHCRSNMDEVLSCSGVCADLQRRVAMSQQQILSTPAAQLQAFAVGSWDCQSLLPCISNLCQLSLAAPSHIFKLLVCVDVATFQAVSQNQVDNPVVCMRSGCKRRTSDKVLPHHYMAWASSSLLGGLWLISFK